MPKPLTREEANRLFYWPTNFAKYFPVAVEKIRQIKGIISFQHSFIFHRIDKKGLAKDYPSATAEFVILYLESKPAHFYPDERVQRVWQQLQQGGVAKEVLTKIREAMFELGYDPGTPG